MKSIQEIRSSLSKISKWPWFWDEKQGPFKPSWKNSQFCAEAPQLISDLCDRLEEAKKALEFYAGESFYASIAGYALEKIK